MTALRWFLCLVYCSHPSNACHHLWFSQQRILMALKNQLRLQQPDLDANLLHDPALPLPHQPGEQARAIPNDVFETGLQYCLDTYVLPHDWRRKVHHSAP